MDILWGVAEFISSYYNRHSQLDYIRHMSQVCHNWRQIILQSPSIWGNMININALAQSSEEWRKQVMLRTGSAELTVYGTIYSNKTASRFLQTLLDQYWSRISIFRVSIWQPSELAEDVWRILWTSTAPSLRTFVLHIYSNSYDLHLPPMPMLLQGSPLFSNTAPLLRMFICPKIHFDLRDNWVSQLSVMHLPQKCTVQSALNILRGCPRVQYLSYQPNPDLSHNLGGNMPDLKSTNLLHLRQLTISGTFDQCVGLVTHINPGTSSLLTMWLDSEERMEQDISYVNMNNLAKILAPYTRSALLENGKKYLKLNLSPDFPFTSLAVHLRTRHWRKKGRAIALLDFGRISSYPLMISIFKLLLDVLSSCNLASVSAFELHLGVDELPNDVYKTLEHILSSLTSLQRLYITGAGLRIIENLPPNRVLLLASLEKVTLRYAEPINQSFEELCESTLSVLRRAKQEAIFPVVLDITDILHNVRSLMDWRPLDEIDGLKVVWHKPGYQEYICGSGRPEKLLIRVKNW